MKEKRAEWMQAQNNIPAARYVFIDESGVNTNMSRRYARPLQGSRAHDAIPLNRGKRECPRKCVNANLLIEANG